MKKVILTLLILLPILSGCKNSKSLKCTIEDTDGIGSNTIIFTFNKDDEISKLEEEIKFDFSNVEDFSIFPCESVESCLEHVEKTLDNCRTESQIAKCSIKKEGKKAIIYKEYTKDYIDDYIEKDNNSYKGIKYYYQNAGFLCK